MADKMTKRTDSKGNPIPTREEMLVEEAKDAKMRKAAGKAYDESNDSFLVDKKCSGGMVKKKAKGGMVNKSPSKSVKPRGMSLMRKNKPCKMY